MIKRMLICVLFVILVTSHGYSRYPPTIAIFPDDERISWCFYIDPGNPFDIWIWCYPGENGQIGAEFAIEYPESGIFPGPITTNTNLVVDIEGDIESGVKVTYNECQYDWNWPLQQQIFLMTNDPVQFYVIPHSGYEYPQFFTCEEVHPTERCCVCELYVNSCPA